MLDCSPRRARTSSSSISAPTSRPTSIRWPGSEDLEETARLVEKEGRRAHIAVADVRDRAALSAAIDSGVAELGRLDIVVANAGIAPLTPGLPPQAFVDAVDVDLVGVLNLVHASLKHLECRGVDHRDRFPGRLSVRRRQPAAWTLGPGGGGYALRQTGGRPLCQRSGSATCARATSG